MIEKTNPSATKLLEHIQRLSAQTIKKTPVQTDARSHATSNRTNHINTILKNVQGRNCEKTAAKEHMSIQKEVRLKAAGSKMNSQTGEPSPLTNLKEIPYRNRIGSFLDTYV
ncbi:MAG: hypothetical protein MRJ65_05620 [Candidatus Brocadiaceae bacterium]|nr:hypothetical protein [Candidatus Brocadiaceae bacterium]